MTKKAISLLCISFLLSLGLEYFLFNSNSNKNMNFSKISFDNSIEEGIQANGEGYFYINDLSKALIHYYNFNEAPRDCYLNYILENSDNTIYELMITEYYEDGTSVMYRHIINYQRPSSMYIVFDKPIMGITINLKSMHNCVFDNKVSFNEDVPFDFVTQRVLRNSFTFMMMQLFALGIFERSRINNGKY